MAQAVHLRRAGHLRSALHRARARVDLEIQIRNLMLEPGKYRILRALELPGRVRCHHAMHPLGLVHLLDQPALLVAGCAPFHARLEQRPAAHDVLQLRHALELPLEIPQRALGRVRVQRLEIAIAGDRVHRLAPRDGRVEMIHQHRMHRIHQPVPVADAVLHELQRQPPHVGADFIQRAILAGGLGDAADQPLPARVLIHHAHLLERLGLLAPGDVRRHLVDALAQLVPGRLKIRADGFTHRIHHRLRPLGERHRLARDLARADLDRHRQQRGVHAGGRARHHLLPLRLRLLARALQLVHDALGPLDHHRVVVRVRLGRLLEILGGLGRATVRGGRLVPGLGRGKLRLEPFDRIMRLRQLGALRIRQRRALAGLAFLHLHLGQLEMFIRQHLAGSQAAARLRAGRLAHLIQLEQILARLLHHHLESFDRLQPAGEILRVIVSRGQLARLAPVLVLEIDLAMQQQGVLDVRERARLRLELGDQDILRRWILIDDGHGAFPYLAPGPAPGLHRRRQPALGAFGVHRGVLDRGRRARARGEFRRLRPTHAQLAQVAGVDVAEHVAGVLGLGACARLQGVG